MSGRLTRALRVAAASADARQEAERALIVLGGGTVCERCRLAAAWNRKHSRAIGRETWPPSDTTRRARSRPTGSARKRGRMQPVRAGDPELVARIKRGLYVPWGAGAAWAQQGVTRAWWQRLIRRAPRPAPYCGFCGANQPPIDIPEGGFVDVTCPSCTKKYRVEPSYFSPPTPTSAA